MKKIFVTSVVLLSAFAVMGSASAVDAKAKAKKKTAKLECVAYDWSPTDTGLSKGFCVQYQSKRKS